MENLSSKPTSTSTSTKSSLCLSCLACCKELHFQIPMPQDHLSMAETIAFYSARGCSIRFTSTAAYAIVPFPCPLLTPFGCSQYLTRPVACRLYSGLNDPLMHSRCKWSSLPSPSPNGK